MTMGWCSVHAKSVAVAALVTLAATTQLCAQGAPLTLLAFNDTAGWRAVPSDGVRLALAPDRETDTPALRFDVNYQGHAGYAVARHAFALPPLPPHWAITLRVRGALPPNTLEIKFIDSSGLNVWWMRRQSLSPKPEWTTLRFRPSDLSFAWGPAGGGPPRNIAAIEIAITAGAGGKGWISLDRLSLVPLPLPVADSVRPTATASSTALGTSPAASLAHDFARLPTRGTRITRTGGWRSDGDGEQQLVLDFHGPRALSGVALDWDARDWARDYSIESSDDGIRWTRLRDIHDAASGRRFIHLPELETAWLRLALHASSRKHGYRLASLRLLPANVAPTRSAFLEAVASAAPLGDWPRALTHQQSYWTVMGIPHDERDALISEDGSVESRLGGFSLEPFVSTGSRLLTWRNGRTTHSLDAGWRPIPTVRRVTSELVLAITAFATGTPLHSVIWVRYRVVNKRAISRSIRLAVELRPVQVNPPWQFLGTPGGAATVHSIVGNTRGMIVNSSESIVAITPGATVRAIAFDAGSVVETLRKNELPRDTVVTDPTGFASGALQWTLALRARDSADVWIALPASGNDAPALGANGMLALAAARAVWDRELSVQLALPGTGAAMARTLRSSLAYVLINARGPALQPGTRSYRRSWIRDGALTSSALLRLGHAADVRAFLDWFTPYVFADGKVPCCVDARGADPVTENDADGELLYLAAEYWRMTHDSATIRRHWPVLAMVAAHLDSLRQTRRTATYRSADSVFVFGLLPPSISHEGYSAKPAYSYWDDWWGVRGLADAALLARIAGDGMRAAALTSSAAEFRADVVASVTRSMALHHMTVMPGAAELGDFDPTSSTIALEPAQALGALPAAAVRASFDSAWANFSRRRSGAAPWDAYTPYEWRQVGSFIRLDQPARAHALANWFMSTRRPAQWHAWGEVVWRDYRAPKFVGDIPHGWVASDFMRATLDMLEYEREGDSTLVIGAGIPVAWARAPKGVTARGIHTWWGKLDFTVRSSGRTVRYTVAGVTPPGGIEIRAPFDARPRAVRVNGQVVQMHDGRAVVAGAPAMVEFDY